MSIEEIIDKILRYKQEIEKIKSEIEALKEEVGPLNTISKRQIRKKEKLRKRLSFLAIHLAYIQQSVLPSLETKANGLTWVL